MKVTRRNFFTTTALMSSSALLGGCTQKSNEFILNKNPLKLGMQTHRIGRDWDVDTIIKNCLEVQLEHVEFRTTYAHGVEVNLSKAERKEIRKKFEDAGIKVSLASGFAYHWKDQKTLRDHIEGTKEYTLLGEDIGALGVRVFPDMLIEDQGVPKEQTLEQIGKAMAEVGQFGYDHGIHMALEIHGKGTDETPNIKKIIDYSGSPHVYVLWNCNESDLNPPGFEANFNMVKDRIRMVHMNDLFEDYPYRLLFKLLSKANYQGYCDAEIHKNPDPVRVLKFYRALFLSLQNAL